MLEVIRFKWDFLLWTVWRRFLPSERWRHSCATTSVPMSGDCTDVEEVYAVFSSEVNYQTMVEELVLAAVAQKSGRNVLLLYRYN